MPVAMRLARQWIAVAALACACASTVSSGGAGSTAPTAPQSTFEQSGGFDRLNAIAEGVAWLRDGNRELTVRDPQVAGHQVLIKVENHGDDADFTVIIPVTRDPEAAKRLRSLAFEGPDSGRDGYWRYAPDWEDDQVANLIESIFRNVWQSPIGYLVVLERRDLGAP